LLLQNKTFAELGLSPKVLAAVEAAGYPAPTPIQSEAIPVAVTGRDVLGIAQTGTGKTAAFVMPMITRLETGRARARMPRSLILAPTRELAAQCEQSFEKYGTNHKLTVALLIGGVSMDDQVKKLDRGVDVLIATPGRLLDHFQRGRVMLMGVEILVIDEADRMLDMGFIPDIEKICKLLPPRRQTLFFSATMPPEITRLVDQFLTAPVRIEVAKPATTAKTITQRFRFLASSEDWDKREALRELIRGETVRNAIIFCNRKRDVAILHKSLVKHGFNAGALHGDMDQKHRMETLDKFRSGEILFLAASDVAARGLDIPDVSHVFNYDVPWAGDDYVHRIGRTGRAGREGVSATIVTPDDLRLIKDIEKVTGEAPVWIGEPPSPEDFEGSGRRRRGRGGREGDRRGGRGERGRRDGRRPEARGETGGAGERSERPARPERRRDRSERRPSETAEGTPEFGAVEAAPRAHPPRRPEQAQPEARRPEGRGEADARPKRAVRPEQTSRPRPERAPRDGQRGQAGGGRHSERPRKEPVEQRGGERPLGFGTAMPAFMRKAPKPAKAD
jgi:superfamily II DNA/RNA helicase